MDNRTDMEKCTIYKRRGDRCEIKCRLGLFNEANHYFQQYKEDGEYDKLLTPTEVIGAPTAGANKGEKV